MAQLTALAAVLGIAFGVAALIFAQGLANGFRNELRDKILRGTAHVTVARADGEMFANWREVATRIRAVEGVTTVEATTYEGALLSGPQGASYAVVRGIEQEGVRALDELKRIEESGRVEDLFQVQKPQMKEDERQPLPVFVGAELAARTGLLSVGEEGWVVTGERGVAPPGFVPRARRVRVAGIFRSGLFDYDSTWIYTSLQGASDIAGGSVEAASAISLEVRDVYAAGDVAARVREALGAQWSVVDWREANRPLFAALELERRTVALIIGLIIIVAALNITTTIALVVVERRTDIAVLSALGARPQSITIIFIVEGAIIGASGAVVGIALGLACVATANHFGLVQLPPDVYSLSAVPLHANARDAAWPAFAAFIVSVLATLYPARRAARTRPAEVLRHG